MHAVLVALLISQPTNAELVIRQHAEPLPAAVATPADPPDFWTELPASPPDNRSARMELVRQFHEEFRANRQKFDAKLEAHRQKFEAGVEAISQKINQLEVDVGMTSCSASCSALATGSSRLVPCRTLRRNTLGPLAWHVGAQ